MTDQPRQVGGGRQAIGDTAPKLAALTDDVLFDDVWNRPSCPPGTAASSPSPPWSSVGTPTSSRTTLSGL